MSEIELHREQSHPTTFAHQIEQAKALAAGSMLPGEYRNQPANVLIAMNLGQAMGLSPAESLYRIAVIKGKPTASAELIASNVRKAGHRLRVVVDEQALSATATIVRADDPEFEFAVTRDMKWAQSMGLASNDNYRKQAPTMLANRAITAVARLACPETLYGVAYSSDEMYEVEQRPTPSSGLASVLADPSPAQVDAPSADNPESAPKQESRAGEDSITSSQLKKIGAAMRERGITVREDALAYVESIIGREIASRNDLTKAEASDVIDAMETPFGQQPAPEPVEAEWTEGEGS